MGVAAVSVAAALQVAGDGLMNFLRALKHMASTGWGLRRAFDEPVRAAIEQAITESESLHGGEIRFALEDNLHVRALWCNTTPRQRALQVFSHLGVWDTQRNNGVLIYVLWADHDVEIVADRAFAELVTEQEWREVCHRMEELFAQDQPRQAAVAGVQAVGRLIARHFPAADRNELPNPPVFL